MTATASPLYLGGHPAVDFLNTAFAPDGVQRETIPDGQALLDWMVGAGLIEEGAASRLMHRLGGKALDSTAAQARRMRERTRDWLERWRAAPRRNYGEEVAALNAHLARGTWRREVVMSDQGLTVVEQLTLNSADALLALLAWHVARLLTREQPSLLKECAGTGCTLWFLDRTKAHRRRFCSSAACGNRAKVAAFRERQRA
jgi:predicted RNA-binding Zn ribbon-like protein